MANQSDLAADQPDMNQPGIPPAPPPLQVINATGSFTSLDTKRLARVGRHKATPEEEAKLLSQATSQALVAARSMLQNGATQATALTTARAAAESILMPQNNSAVAAYLSRRKAKQQANVVASMALMAAQNTARTHQSQQMSYDMTEISEAANMFGPGPTPNSNAAVSRLSGISGGTGSFSGRPPSVISRMSGSAASSVPSNSKPPSVVRRDFSRQDDPSSIAGSATETHEESQKNVRLAAISKITESPTKESLTQTDEAPASGGSQHSGNWNKRKERSKAVAKLLMPLEDDTNDDKDMDYPSNRSKKEDSQAMSYSSEEMNTQGSFSSEGSVAEKPKRQISAFDPFSALYKAVLCGMADETTDSKEKRQERKAMEEEEDDIEEIIEPIQFREPYQKSRVHSLEEREKHHTRKTSSESSANIVKALESLERERMVAQSQKPGEMRSTGKATTSTTKDKDSMEKLVLRALASTDSKSSPPIMERDAYRSPGSLNSSPASKEHPPRGKQAASSPRVRWRRSRKSSTKSVDLE